MRAVLLFLSVLATSLACKSQPRSTAGAPVAVATAAAPAAAESLTGKVAETIDAGQYTYLRLQTAAGETWAAVPSTKAGVGTQVTVQSPMWMENFKSAKLNRTWTRIAFGTLAGEAGEADAKLPAGHPPTGAQPPDHPGMFAAQAAGLNPDEKATLPSSHPPLAAAADVGAIRVAKAGGANGRTVSDIHARRAQLKDKSVAVRGKVVKTTNGVLGKNWLHLRDGTGEGSTADLTVASTDTAQVGDTVLATGTVRLDRDLGAGYHYDVLVEDAKLQKE
jgi:hypothetical protein